MVTKTSGFHVIGCLDTKPQFTPEIFSYEQAFQVQPDKKPLSFH